MRIRLNRAMWALGMAVALGTSAPSARATQLEDTKGAVAKAAAADRELNATYQRLLQALDKEGRQKLIASELAWLKFRDSQAAFEADWYRGGSLSSEQYAASLARTTQARTRELREALDVKKSM